jgi:hypothetical protein
MPRYYLNFDVAGVVVPDREGVELKAIDFRTPADWTKFIRSILRAEDECAFDGGHIEVTDDFGRVVAQVRIGSAEHLHLLS